VAARKATHARILLHADESSDAGYFKDEDIAEVLHIGRVTVERVRKRFVEEGLESALIPKPRTRHRPKKLDGEAEAFLVATACSKAPEGRTDWTLQLLADRLVECQVVDSISAEAVRQVLKKTRSNPG
jgi:transposase